MKATPVYSFKQAFGVGRIEGVIWQVPEPVPPSEHRYKYRLVYVVAGERVVGYDNEGSVRQGGVNTESELQLGGGCYAAGNVAKPPVSVTVSTMVCWGR